MANASATLQAPAELPPPVVIEVGYPADYTLSSIGDVASRSSLGAAFGHRAPGSVEVSDSSFDSNNIRFAVGMIVARAARGAKDSIMAGEAARNFNVTQQMLDMFDRIEEDKEDEDS